MAILILAVGLFASYCMASPIDPKLPTLELLSSSGFSELKGELVKHNMTSVNNITEPVTIFAPSNDAFKYLKENPWTKNMTHEMMHKLLGRVFVLRKKILPDDIKNEMIVDTMSGEKLRFNVYPRVKTVNGVRIVIEPHVETPLAIIYRINRFPMAPPEDRDLFETLNKRKERFSTLLRAIEVANLKDTLKKGGPFTLFAPTNEAFNASLTESKLTKLMQSPADLKTVLLGHLANGTYFLSGLLNSPDIRTLDGRSNKIVVNGTNVTVDRARIILREGMIACNGAIHVIDHVLTTSNSTSTV